MSAGSYALTRADLELPIGDAVELAIYQTERFSANAPETQKHHVLEIAQLELEELAEDNEHWTPAEVETLLAIEIERQLGRSGS
jgi:hypothetical protein